jgi:hypothetical protein
MRVNDFGVHRTKVLLHCGKSPIIGLESAAAAKQERQQEGCTMTDVWDTKDGRRRVRRDPPTVEEAVLAAQGLTDELGEQIEIVMSLMQVSPDEARGAILSMGQRKDVNHVTITGRAGAPRAVVVERLAPRRLGALRPTASVGYRGRV